MSAWTQTMLLWSWQALLLVGLILIVVKVGRSQSAAARHSFWLLGVLVIAILPAANIAIRALPTPIAIGPIMSVAQLPAVTAVMAVTQSASEQAPAPMRDRVSIALFAVWIAGVLISGVRSVRTHRRWRRIAQSALGVEHNQGSIPLGYSTEVETPILVGTLRPMILLPADIDTWTNDEERRAVLLHEMAHVQRRDHWVSPVQALLGAIFFFHPAVRYALRQLILERELACDERVLAAGANPSTYAEIILKVAERSIPGRQSDCPAFNPSGKILERRIDMILSDQPFASSRWHLPAIGRAAIVLALAALLLPQRAVTAEMLVPPPVEIRAAAFEPLVQGMSVIASAITKEASAEPVQAPPAQTQAPAQSGTVSGTIFDPSGAVVPGVTVTLLAAPPGTSRTAVSNVSGLFSIPQVPPGQYTLQTKLPDFANIERTILMRSGETSAHDVFLPLRSIATHVQITASRPTVLQPPNSPPTPQRVGGVIAQPSLISQVKPQYPAAARAAGIQDYVQLQAIIGRDGSITFLQVDPVQPGSGNPAFIKAAMEAVQQWRYRPGTLNGSPIDVPTTIVLNFMLD